MPELPEVESIRFYLKQNVEEKNLRVEEIIFHRFRHKKSTIVNFPDAPTLLKKLHLSEVASLWEQSAKDCKLNFRRRGKYLIILFQKKNRLKNPAVVVHLRMSGAFFREQSLDAAWDLSMLKKHVHVTLCLKNLSEKPSSKERYLFFDPRTFATWDCFFDEQNAMRWLLKKNLGVEPQDQKKLEEVFLSYFEKLKKKHEKKSPQKNGCCKEIKSLLLDQNVVCGLGNIYACESLFVACIHPQTLVCQLKKNEWKKLSHAIAKTIERALQAGGVTIEQKGGYRLPDGSRGGYGERALVYGRAGGDCFHCGAAIVSMKQRGRSSYWCSQCQKKKNIF